MPWSVTGNIRGPQGAAGAIAQQAVTLKASGAQTASTTSPAVDLGVGGGVLSFEVVVTARSGTSPTLSGFLETSEDNTNWLTAARVGTNWTAGDLTAPTNLTAATSTTRGIAPVARYIRWRSVIGGTAPSWTYSVTARKLALG